MQSLDKTRAQLLEELVAMGQRISELEATQARLLGTEKALRESEERFRLLYENAPLGYQSLDENGYFLEVNQAWLDTLGYSREEVIGKWFGDFLAPGYQERFKINFPKFKAAGEIHWVEFEMLRKDGSQISVAFDGQIGRDEQGQFRQTHCILHDITERKWAEEARERSEKIYRQMFEGTRAVKLLIDPESGELIDANPAAADFYGYTVDDLKRLKISDINILTPEQISAEMTKAKTGRRGHFFFNHRLASGEIRDVEVHSSPLDVGDKRLLYSIIHDVTDRKRAEESLVRADRDWARTFNAISDLVMVLDDRHKILRANKAMADALGMTERELIGKCCFELVHGEKEPPAFCPHAQLLADGEEHSAEVVEPRLGGIYDVRVSPLIGQSGQVIGSVHVTRDITERKRIEQALQDSEERLRLTLEASQVGIWDWDVKTDQWYASPIYYSMLGYEPKTGLADRREWLERLHPDDRAYVNEKIQDVLTREFREYEYEARLRHADGTYRWQHVKGVGIRRAEDGKVTRMLGIRMDITERKLAEEALSAASLYNRSLIEASLDPLVTISAEGKITDVNRATERVTGCSRDRLIGTDFADYFADPQRARRGYERAFREGLVEDYELDIRHTDGHLTPVVYNASVYHDSSGRVAGLFAAARDISQRKQAEEKNLWLATIVESSDDAIIGKSLDGTITSWNKGAEHVYGYKDTEAVGKHISILASPDRQNELSTLLARLRRGEHVQHHETVRRKKDGREIDISLAISPIKSAEGGIIGASTIARDITEQKSIQRQLLQAQKMESIGTLAGGIAHDFNNLLTVILGFSELLLIGKDERDPARADLQKINEAARNGAELVHRILAFSRKTQINPRPLNLNHEIQQVKKLLVRTIPKMIEIELLLSDELPVVNADPVQIEQLLMNLAVNAKDAMPDGGKLFIETQNATLDEDYCKTHLGSTPGDYVLLQFSDTGQGMDRDTLEHIFEPFYTTKGLGEGTGLGLAMVYGMVKQHGGYIMCYSEPGQGTTFKIFFPAKPSHSETERKSMKPTLRGGTETILLVDDEVFIRDLGERILNRAGYEVITASNGKEALEIYRKEQSRIGLVILDLIMPEMGGKQCLDGILSLDPSVKVVIASGFSTTGPTKEAVGAGAKGFVTKPYDMHTMLRTVREVLDGE
jgi:two-component system cell cycle sensor histidine kinase/response regulator CckA